MIELKKKKRDKENALKFNENSPFNDSFSQQINFLSVCKTITTYKVTTQSKKLKLTL